MTNIPRAHFFIISTASKRRTVLSFVLSALLHVALLLIFQFKLHSIAPKPIMQRPLEIVINHSRVPTPPTENRRNPAAPKAGSKATTPHPTRKRASRPNRSFPKQKIVETPAKTRPTASPDMDMAKMLDAARERRRRAEELADQADHEKSAHSAPPPSANDIARANIAFQARKTNGAMNGIFEIINQGPRVAQYVFHGWMSDSQYSQRQTITVDAGPHGSIEKAIIDSMIHVIRQYYSGDFNWESHRLGRIVVLSARVADTRHLETFLMQEFFGADAKHG